jgi:hypothetical protein
MALPSVPSGVVTYWAYDAHIPGGPPVLLAELPLTGVSFSSRLNSPGSFNGSLNLNDPKVLGAVSSGATTPGRTLLFVDMDGTIVWGGILWTRTYDNQDNVLQVGGSEAWSYFQQRVQAADYSLPPTSDKHGGGPTFWVGSPDAASYAISAQIVSDSCAQLIGGVNYCMFSGWYANNGGASSLYNGAINLWVTGSPVLIYPSFPIQQYQVVDDIVTELAQTGYTVGFDWAVDWTWSAGTGSEPIATLNFHFPYRGRAVSATGFGIDTALSVPYTWPEDATQMADQVYGLATGAGGYVEIQNQPSSMTSGWPLLEKVNTYSQTNDQQSLSGSVTDDLDIAQLPVITPTFVCPLYGEGAQIDLREVLMGDEVQIFIDPDPRFPAGYSGTNPLRITGTDITIADEGLSTVQFTCTIPPLLAADPPSWGSTLPNGSGQWSTTVPTGGSHIDTGPHGGTPLRNFPTNSISFLRWAFVMPGGALAVTTTPALTLQVFDSVGNEMVYTDFAGWFLQPVSPAITGIAVNPHGSMIIDGDALPGVPPYHFNGSSTVSPITAVLTILTWSKTSGNDTLVAYARYFTKNGNDSYISWTQDSSMNSGYNYM